MAYIDDGIKFGTGSTAGGVSSFTVQPMHYSFDRAPRLPNGDGGETQDGLDAIELEFGFTHYTQFADVMNRANSALTNGKGVLFLRYFDELVNAWVTRRCTATTPVTDPYGQGWRSVRWKLRNLGLPSAG